jgi:hypothetical protein
MKKTISRSTEPRTRKLAGIILALAVAGGASGAMAAVDPDQSKVPPPVGDGWQMLGAPAANAVAHPAQALASAPVPALATNPVTQARLPSPSQGGAGVTTLAAAAMNMDVNPVVLPGKEAGATGTLNFAVTPQDMNLRNALDRWLQMQGWQLAWKIDDDLPLEFNSTFSGDFKTVLQQVMASTTYMRTPARICRHLPNNVIRVVLRGANCKD